MTEIYFDSTIRRDDEHAQARTALALDAHPHEVTGSSHTQSRGLHAALTLLGSTAAGAFAEGASMADLAVLKAGNPQIWGTYTRQHLSSVREGLLNVPAYMNTAERSVMDSMQIRGAVKGVAAGAIGIAGSIGVDALFFRDTPRGQGSQIGSTAMPFVALLPVNPYARTAAIVTAYTVGRLYDKYLA